MTKKLSAWGAPGEKPPCVGVWETDYINLESPTYQYWNGQVFKSADDTPFGAYTRRDQPSYCNQSKVRFRGLAEKP